MNKKKCLIEKVELYPAALFFADNAMDTQSQNRIQKKNQNRQTFAAAAAFGCSIILSRDA